MLSLAWRWLTRHVCSYCCADQVFLNLAKEEEEKRRLEEDAQVEKEEAKVWLRSTNHF